jgi:hypothetical protein
MLFRIIVDLIPFALVTGFVVLLWCKGPEKPRE